MTSSSSSDCSRTARDDHMEERTMIELTASDGTSFSAYRAEPEQTPKGAVVVLQDVFGLTPEIRKAADAFAAAGYVAIAPSLFDRVRPGIGIGHDSAGKDEAAAIGADI